MHARQRLALNRLGYEVDLRTCSYAVLYAGVGKKYIVHNEMKNKHLILSYPILGPFYFISVCFGLFRLIFCLFRFNQNTETRCFGIEAKQPKQKFCFG